MTTLLPNTILPVLIGTRCKEPCSFDPMCRLWFESKDNHTTEDRAWGMIYMMEDINCPLYKCDSSLKTDDEIYVKLSPFSNIYSHYPKDLVFVLCNHDERSNMSNIKYKKYEAWASICVPSDHVILFEEEVEPWMLEYHKLKE